MLFAVYSNAHEKMGYVKAASLYYAYELACKNFPGFGSIHEDPDALPSFEEVSKEFLVSHCTAYFASLGLTGISFAKLNREELYRIFQWIDKEVFHAPRTI